ncbi:hypothetical protein GCM10009736_25290 [Actinomadura bangladeshensis]
MLSVDAPRKSRQSATRCILHAKREVFAVVDEDGGGAGDYIVGVGAVDGQVVGDLGCGVAVGLLDGGGGAVGLLEFVARLDVGRVYEGRLRDVVDE